MTAPMMAVGRVVDLYAGPGGWDEGQGAAFLAVCSCNYGPCGYCSGGRHDRCTHLRWRPSPGPETYIQSPSGAAITAVWLSGRPCRWVCACTCRDEVAAVVAPAFEQMDLFALAGASA